MITQATDHLSSRDGTELAWHHWSTPNPLRGSVLLVHGVGEHLQRYRHVAEALTHSGFEVGGVDLRGHGLSSGKRGHILRWQNYVDDIHAAAERLPDPLFVTAHSMGALVTLDFLREDTRTKAAVLSGPLLGVAVEAPRWKTGLAGLLSRIAPSLQLANEIDPAEVCRNIDVQRRYQEDPLNSNRVTPRWYTEMRAAIERVRTYANEYQLPLQVHAGSEDKIVSIDALQSFLECWGGVHELKIWPDGKHEVFNETFCDQVLHSAISWIQAQVDASAQT
ncbi:MAG: lysophospholipase [Planctomycetes bacterium]|nr:lysophospholipase [Planctomycetota bacterium]